MKTLVDCKICKICGQEKVLDDFVLNKQCKDGRAGQCKQCARDRTKAWNQANQARRTAEAAQRARNAKLRAMEYMGGKCADCGNIYPPCVYQFHHLDMSQKDQNPSHLFNCKWERLKAELDKCVMLCANCHMIRHHHQADRDVVREEGNKG